MYELDRLVGAGGSCRFFRLKDHENLGTKMVWNLPIDTERQYLKREKRKLKIAKIPVDPIEILVL